MRSKFGIKAALLGGSACLLLVASPLHAQLANGLVVEPRVFNDFPTSTETIQINANPAVPTPLPTPAGNLPASIPASVTIHNTNMVNANPGNTGANRDDLVVSVDGGLTPYTGNINQGFSISGFVTLSDGANDPRKEAGIRINSTVSGDAIFNVNSDGEIVAFGAGAPFYSFRPAIEAAYIPGQQIFLKETYTPAPGGTTGANPGTMDYQAQLIPGGTLFDSGPLFYSNLEGGPTNPQIAFYEQTGSTGAADFVNAQFNNITATVPEPTTLSLLGLGCVTLLSRRRSAKLV